MSRRNFLTLAAGLSLQPLIQIGRGSANERIRVAIVGVNGRGNALIKARTSSLTIAAETESIVGDDAAAALSGRAFRQPYAIPHTV